MNTLRFEARGRTTPAGEAVIKVGASERVAVRLKTTAVAHAGTPAAPAIVRERDSP
ncbi:unannotated protein [freshwater metagenome]|uniref:Unannotated protein n=1 Tax=freshwater metagenome TaxID=449393 RepID=A0A6J6LLN5_9ZZZZ